MDSKATLFEADPNWTSFAKKNGYLPESLPLDVPPVELDIPTNRKQQAINEGDWARNHPLSAVGYSSYQAGIHVRDGTAISVKISVPSRLVEASGSSRQEKLPVLFVTHGGGWIQ